MSAKSAQRHLRLVSPPNEHPEEKLRAMVTAIFAKLDEIDRKLDTLATKAQYRALAERIAALEAKAP